MFCYCQQPKGQDANTSGAGSLQRRVRVLQTAKRGSKRRQTYVTTSSTTTPSPDRGCQFGHSAATAAAATTTTAIGSK
jgi:hypothetical protein